MKKKLKLYLSPNLALESIDDGTESRVICNKVTGKRLKISNETLKILLLFREKITINQVIKKLNLSVEDRKILFDIIQQLFNFDLLIHQDEQIIADEELLMVKPKVTFVNCPYLLEDELKDGNILFCGIPVDFATTGNPGARHAPSKMREISSNFLHYDRDIFTAKNKGWFSMESNRWLLKEISIDDYGDIVYTIAENPEALYRRITKLSKKIFGSSYFPLFIGGDHSITAPIINGCCQHYKDVVIIQFDAHTDLADWQMGTNHHHGNMMSRILAENPEASVYQFGLRGFAGLPSENSRVKQISSSQLEQKFDEVIKQIPNGKCCYITLDIDSLDPSFAPGTGTPVPFGLKVSTILRIIEKVKLYNTIIGLDIVEVNPLIDTRDVTSNLAFHLIMEILGEVFAT